MQPVIAVPSRALVLTRTLLGLATLLAGVWALERVLAGLGWLYAAGFLLHVWGLYPRLICLHCPHYGRVCPSGGGKIAALLYDRSSDRDDPAAFAKRKRLGHLAGISLRAAPIVLLALLLAASRRGDEALWAAWVLLLVLGFAEGKLYSSRTCRGCRAIANCPARWSADPHSYEPDEANPS